MTRGDINALGAFIGAKVDAMAGTLGYKLDLVNATSTTIRASTDAVKASVDAANQSAYQNALSVKYSIDAANTNALASSAKLLEAVKAIPGGTGTGIDMTATNALLNSIKANTEPGTLAGGDTCAGGAPAMTGLNVTESYIAAQAWKTHCALENEFKDSGNGKHGDLNDASTSDGFIQSSGDGSGGTGSGGLDDSGFGWGRSCPASEHVAVMGHDFVIDSSMLCTAMSAISIMVLLVGAIVSVRILATA